MTYLSQQLREAARRLAGIGAGNPRLEAEYLAAHALGLERLDLLRRRESDPVPAEAAERFEHFLRRRLGREPLQYVLGTMPFCELELEVGPGVLIPRSETEVLVEKVAEVARGIDAAGDVLAGSERPRPASSLLIDVGTGSGAILLALLHRLPGWIGTGTDASAAALDWARRNRLRAAGAGRANLVRGDLCETIRPASASVVVSNPPYIRTSELGSLAPEIRDHEPAEALDGGEDGLDAVRRLLPQAAAVLRPGGWLALELAPDQPDQVEEFLARAGGFDPAQIFEDLAGRPRGILARKG